MNIAIIPSADLSYNSGSIIYAKNLFNYLHSKGHRAFLIGSRVPEDISQDLMAYIIIEPSLLNHPVIDDRTVTNREYIDSIFAISRYLLDIVDRFGLDVVHAHYGSFNSYAAYLVHQMVGVPYIISSFGRDLNLGYKHDHRIRWFIDESFPKASAIIVTDEKLRKTAKALRRLEDSGEDIVEIGMPVDKRIFTKKVDVQLKPYPVIATINSCFSPEKGIEVILEAFSKLLQTTKARLIIAGTDDHPEQVHRHNLERIIKELDISQEVDFVGYLSREDVGLLLQSCNMLIDARVKGNFSSVLLEAMFTNTLVLASDTEASRKVITNGWNGRLFKIADATHLHQLMLEMLEDKESQREMKLNIKKWADLNGSEYLDEICFQKVEELYISSIIKWRSENGESRSSKRSCKETLDRFN